MKRLILALAALFSAPAIAATPVFDAPSVSVSENGGSAAFTIIKTGKASSYSKIRVETVDGSARAGIDYRAVDTTVTVANSATRVVVPIPILDNASYQGNRTLAVRLTITRNGQLLGAYVPPTVTIFDDEQAPAPPPAPSSGLAGETPIADNFDVTQWLEPGEPPHASPDEVGAFRFNCLAGHLAKDDPIVYPGQPGKSHLHQFFGNTDTNANSNYASLRMTGGSTCTRSVGTSPQRSAYWMPAMLDGAGNVVKPDWLNTYYKQMPAGDPNCAVTLDPAVKGRCVPFPNGIRFIMGYDMKTMSGGPADTNSRDYWAMGFTCDDKVTSESYSGIKHTIAEVVATGKCPAGSWLRVFGTFPQCWDGKNLDTPDHRSQIVLPPQAICPGTHPFRVPEIALSAFFTVDANFFAGKWCLASDEMMSSSMGGAPITCGTTLHFDYWEAWSPVIKDLWQRNCIDGHLTCSIGNVGDGRKVRGMGFDTEKPVHVLVPLSAIP